MALSRDYATLGNAAVPAWYGQVRCHHTYMAKLTLSVDSQVNSCAKQYARRRGISVSEMVEGYLSAVAKPASSRSPAPVLQSVRGILKHADLDDYGKHLLKKYR